MIGLVKSGKDNRLIASTATIAAQLDASYHLEKPYQVEREGPDFASFDIEVDSQRFWGRNGSHMEMNVCFRFGLFFCCFLQTSTSGLQRGDRGLIHGT